MRFFLPVSLVLVIVTATAVTEGQAPGVTRPSGPPVTFAKSVAPILQNHCLVCHRPNTFAPMSLVTYDDARPWAKAIKQKVVAREMPPWFIDRNVGIQHFDNDVSLSDEEVATIVKWVDGGAEKGNPADMPPPRTFPDENQWQFVKQGEQPDLVASLPKDYMMRASGADQYPGILVDPGLKEDRYLYAVQIIPTKGYKVIHHIRTALVAPVDESARGDAAQAAAGGEDAGAFLNEYAIGKGADVFPEGSGRLIKAGTKVNVSFHLHATGKETPVNIALGLKFYPKGYKPKHIIISSTVSSHDVDIRPNTADVRSDNYRLLTKPIRLLSYQPHMHTRGKAACMEAILPTADGGFHVEPLNCARFLFNWHLNYVYAEDAAPLLPAGTMLHMIEWHDNSPTNKVNPDPDAQVTYGQRTIDEMNGPWISFYEMSEQEFKQELEERRAQQTRIASAR